MPPAQKSWLHPLAYVGQLGIPVCPSGVIVGEPIPLRSGADQPGRGTHMQRPHSLTHSLKHAHTYCVSLYPQGNAHLSHMGRASQKSPIFSSHGSTTGGTWCYINAPCVSLLVLLVLWASPFAVVPIDSHLLAYTSPANRTWPSGYQHSYDVPVVWYVCGLSISTTHTLTQKCIYLRVLWQCRASGPQWANVVTM